MMVWMLALAAFAVGQEVTPFGEGALQQIRIGVLAKRSIGQCMEKWGPTAEYLTREIPDCRFEIVPLVFEEIDSAVERGMVDFVLTNSSSYVGLEYLYGANRIATLKNRSLDSVYTVFGGVIFCRADREDIWNLDDLKGKTFMAPSKDSFGGWHAVWRELKEHGIDPHHDFRNLSFAGSHDAVVYAVRNGVDAGSVRTDALERMAIEGKIRLEDFRVFKHDHTGKEVCDFPFQHSTDMYPEWPMAKLVHTSNELAEKVAIALVSMPADSPAARAAKCAGWTVPLNYQTVHECLKELRIGPYKDYGKITLTDMLRQHWLWLATCLVVLIIMIVVTAWVIRLNRNLAQTYSKLQISKDRFDRLAEQNNTITWEVDADGLYTYVSHVSEMVIGYRPEELVGRKHFCDLHPEAGREAFKAAAFEVFEKKEQFAGMENLVQTKDGSVVWVSTNGLPLLNTDGSLRGYRGSDTDITECKHAEETLKETQQYTRGIIEASLDPLVTISSEGKITDVNHATELVTGYPRDKLIGTDLSDYFTNSQKASQGYREVFKEGYVRDYPLEIKHLDGKITSVVYNASVYRNTRGDIIGVFAAARDITEQSKMEDALRESETMFRTLYESSSDAVMLLDDKGFFDCNEATVKMFACKDKEEFCSKGPADVSPVAQPCGTDSMELANKHVAAAMKDGSNRFEWVHKRINGTDFQAEVLLNVMELDGKGIIQAVVRDITERKRAEQEVKRVCNDLVRFIETANAPVIGVDMEYKIDEWNRMAETITGYSKAEVIGQNIIDMYIAEEYKSSVKSVLEDARNGHDTANFEFSLFTKDKEKVDMLLNATTRRNDAGDIIGIVSVGQNITVSKRAEKQLAQQMKDIEKTRSKAEAANEAKSQFLANMSHEIRTPMNAIIGMTDLVLDTELEGQQREFLGIVSQSADNLLALINDVLDFSKIEAGQMTIEQIDYSLRVAIEGAVSSLSLKAHEKRIELISFTDPLVPDWLSGDPTRIRQIIINLIGNSIKFTEDGEVLLRVELESDCDPIRLHFSILDTGIGIPEDKLESVFESFTQADGSTTRTYGGTGLGTTISKQFVEAMGGVIWIESSTNETGVGGPGSTVHFAIPITLAESERPMQIPIPFNTVGKRVLIVDDNASNRALLTALTENWEMYPTTVASGEEALQAIGSSEDFSLVLLDYLMPEMDGLGFAERMRSDTRHRDTKIILLSSTGQSIGKDILEKLGISSFVFKPVKQSALYDAIVNALNDAGTVAENCELRTTGDDIADSENLVGTDKRVLLVEDNKFNMILAKKLLEKEGFEVATAENGQIAVEAVESEYYDLIFMDVQMPVLNGYEATGKIREMQAVSGDTTPIIAMTANALQGDKEKCLEAGMDDYISKPINPKKLRECIVTYITTEPVRQGG